MKFNLEISEDTKRFILAHLTLYRECVYVQQQLSDAVNHLLATTPRQSPPITRTGKLQ